MPTHIITNTNINIPPICRCCTQLEALGHHHRHGPDIHTCPACNEPCAIVIHAPATKPN